MIDEKGKQLVKEGKYCNSSNYLEFLNKFDAYMNKLNNTENEKYTFDGIIMID